MLYRLSSEVIYGESEIVAFNEELKTMPPDAPRSKHLFIGLIPDHDAEGARKVCNSILEGLVLGREETDNQRAERTRRNSHLSTFCPVLGYSPDIWQDSVGGIISQHRDTLESLTYLTTTNHIDFRIFGRLPNLRDLTIVRLGSDDMLYHAGRDNNRNRQHTQFPSLERLRLSHFAVSPDFMPDDFRHLSPNLTHLHISGRMCYPGFDRLPRDTRVWLQPILNSRETWRVGVPGFKRILAVQGDMERTTILEPVNSEEGIYGFFDALLDWLDVHTLTALPGWLV